MGDQKIGKNHPKYMKSSQNDQFESPKHQKPLETLNDYNDWFKIRLVCRVKGEKYFILTNTLAYCEIGNLNQPKGSNLT